MKRNRKKIAIVLILFVVSAMMMGLALATIAGRISTWLISIGFLLMLTSLFMYSKSSCLPPWLPNDGYKVNAKKSTATIPSKSALFLLDNVIKD